MVTGAPLPKASECPHSASTESACSGDGSDIVNIISRQVLCLFADTTTLLRSIYIELVADKYRRVANISERTDMLPANGLFLLYECQMVQVTYL